MMPVCYFGNKTYRNVSHSHGSLGDQRPFYPGWGFVFGLSSCCDVEVGRPYFMKLYRRGVASEPWFLSWAGSLAAWGSFTI